MAGYLKIVGVSLASGLVNVVGLISGAATVIIALVFV